MMLHRSINLWHKDVTCICKQQTLCIQRERESREGRGGGGNESESDLLASNLIAELSFHSIMFMDFVNPKFIKAASVTLHNTRTSIMR